jgi:hypothetical protein
MVFLYYISDIRGKLNSKSRKVWTVISMAIILASIIWGFSVLGSPRTQQFKKYDEQKVSDLQQLNSAVGSYYVLKGNLPKTFSDLISGSGYYYFNQKDPQTNQPYEYVLTDQNTKSYQLCAVFNKNSEDRNKNPMGAIQSYPESNGVFQSHPAGHYCFDEAIPASQYKIISPGPGMPQ